jgi:hypothetical protein
MPSLAQYLFHLADDPKALERHRRSRDEAEQQMSEFSLTEKQREILHSNDPERIQREANAELREQPGVGKPMSLTVHENFIGPWPPRH